MASCVLTREELLDVVRSLKRIGYDKQEAGRYLRDVHNVRRGYTKLVEEGFVDIEEDLDDDI